MFQPDPHSGSWKIQGMSDIFLIAMTTEESICRGMFLTAFSEYVYVGECESTHMFASQNGESRLTSTYAMTSPFHPWNEVERCCMLARETEGKKRER